MAKQNINTQLDKIIRTLDLAKSDARDKTAEGIVEYILYCINEPVSQKDLNEWIFFGHEPERPEQLLKLDHPLIAGVGSHGEFYLAPVKKFIDKTPRDWFRNPDIK